MANQIIAPDVVRYTVHQSYNGRPVINVIDMVVLDQEGGLVDRDEAVEFAAGDVLDAWHQYVRPFQSIYLTCEKVTWVDLNSEDGSTGEKTSTDDSSWPANGSTLGEGQSPNVCALVTKQTRSQRSSRSGRMYVGGLSELQTDGALLTTSMITEFQGSLDAFTEALTETGIVSAYSTFPTVVHTRTTGSGSNRVVTYVGNTQIQSFAAQKLLATQRRRLRP